MLSARYGARFLRCVIGALHHRQRQAKSTNAASEQRLLVLHSHAWHEIAVLLWDTSFNDLAQTVLELSEMTFGALLALRSDPQAAPGLKNDLEMIATTPSLISDMIQCDPQTVGHGYSDRAAHVFLHTTTTLGFDLAMFNRNSTFECERVSAADAISWSTRFYTKSGHLRENARIVAGSAATSIDIAVGKGDFWMPRQASGTSRDLVESIVDASRAASSSACTVPVSGRHTLFGCSAALPQQPSINQPATASHYPSLTRLAPALLIPEEDISETRELCRRACVARASSRRLLSMLSVYNDAMMDTLMLASFTELLPYIEFVRSSIEQATSHGTNPGRFINTAASHFEHAYRNRFRSGHRLGDVSDYEIDFKGSVQQLLSGLDAACCVARPWARGVAYSMARIA